MNRAEGRKARLRILASILMLTVAAGIFLSSSYAWIKRQWAASIEGSSLRIEASGALAFKLEEDVSDTIDLATQMGSDFVLSPVSSSSGESRDFFTLIRNTEQESDYYYKHISCVDPKEQALDWQNTGIKYGYIEQSFQILYSKGEGGSTDYMKFVYLDPELTHLLNGEQGSDAAGALRISITVASDNGIGGVDSSSATYILGSEARTAQAIINDTYTAEDDDHVVQTYWKADGATYYLKGADGELTERTRIADPEHPENLAGIGLTESVSVEAIDHYDGGITELDGKKYIDPALCLFSISSSTPYKNVTVRIWLEGCDQLCDDHIAGRQLDMCLSFAAANCIMTPVVIDGENHYQIIEQE